MRKRAQRDRPGVARAPSVIVPPSLPPPRRVRCRKTSSRVGGAARCPRRPSPSSRDDRGQRAHPVGHRRADPPRLDIDLGVAARPPGDERRAPPPGRPRRAPRRRSSRRPARPSAASGVPSAITRPWSITAIRSASWSASSSVLRGQHHGRPLGDQRADRRPHLVAPARVEPGRRLVEEEHRRATGSARRPGPAAAASRPSTARPACAPASAEPEPLQQLVRPARAPRAAPRWNSRPNRTRFCRPLSTSSTAAFWPTSPIRRAHARRVARHVDARPPRAAPVGAQQRGQDPYRVVLPAPLGPSSPHTVPARDGEVQPGHAP